MRKTESEKVADEAYFALWDIETNTETSTNNLTLMFIYVLGLVAFFGLIMMRR
jgi:hypothetical protein